MAANSSKLLPGGHARAHTKPAPVPPLESKKKKKTTRVPARSSPISETEIVVVRVLVR